MTPDDLNNPLIREIQQAHDGLSPAAQDVVQAVPHLLVRNGPTPGAAGAAPLVKPLGPSPAPAAPAATAAPLVRTPAAPDIHQQKLEKFEKEGSGISQIHNPFIRGLARVGDVAGSILAPGAMAMIPGTTLHNRQLINTEQQHLNEETKRSHEQAQTGLETAQTREAEARTNQIENPKFAPENVHVLPDGTVVGVSTDPKTGEASAHVLYKGDPKVESQVIERNVSGTPHNILVNKATGADIRDLGEAKPLATKEAETPLTDEEITRANAQNVRRWAVNHGNQPVPADLVLKKGATKSDLADMEKSLGGTESAEATKAARDQANATREDTRQQQQRNREDQATEREYITVTNRLNKQWETMEKQKEAIGQAKAELNGGAVGQAVGVVKTLSGLASGQGSGVRITQAELNGLIHARGIKGDFEGWINGLAGQGKLSGEQLQQMQAVLSDVERRVAEKESIYNETLDKLGTAGDRKEIRSIESEFRKRISGGGDEHAGKIQVQIPGQQPGWIPADQKDSFLKKYPNGKVL